MLVKTHFGHVNLIRTGTSFEISGSFDEDLLTFEGKIWEDEYGEYENNLKFTALNNSLLKRKESYMIETMEIIWKYSDL